MSTVVPNWLTEKELFIDSWAKQYVISSDYVSGTVGVHAEQLRTGEVQVIRISDRTQLSAVNTFTGLGAFTEWFSTRAIPELEAVIR